MSRLGDITSTVYNAFKQAVQGTMSVLNSAGGAALGLFQGAQTKPETKTQPNEQIGAQTKEPESAQSSSSLSSIPTSVTQKDYSILEESDKNTPEEDADATPGRVVTFSRKSQDIQAKKDEKFRSDILAILAEPQEGETKLTLEEPTNKPPASPKK